MDREILVVSGGYMDLEFLRRVIDEKERYIIGVDRGLEGLDALGVKADLAVGDFDSAPPHIKALYDEEHIIKLNPQKDYTDTHVAVMEALGRNPKAIILVGATGGRLDHMLANVSLLSICTSKNVPAFMIDTKNKIRIIDRPVSIKKICQYGAYVSLISFTDKVTGVTLKGFKYKLTDKTLVRNETIGISNEIEREEGFITFEDGELMVIESKD
ncbi:MAG: thiamine diphosphokinase [Clostridium sp.]|nr:thiamine diphosphokinase [Clostridium sp.]MCM1209677.1 thiamine diphosphokinase [Ruminococcus sp.]